MNMYDIMWSYHIDPFPRNACKMNACRRDATECGKHGMERGGTGRDRMGLTHIYIYIYIYIYIAHVVRVPAVLKPPQMLKLSLELKGVQGQAYY